MGARLITGLSPLTYSRCRALLGDRYFMKLGHNTFLTTERRIEDPRGTLIYQVQLHGNVILRYHADGRVQIFDGGHRSQTTKHRLNRLGPVSVCGIKGEWYVGLKPFQSGMTVQLAVTCPRCGVCDYPEKIAWNHDRKICGVCCDREDIGD
jgi:hypothetical protein